MDKEKKYIVLVPGHSIESQSFTMWTNESEWSFCFRACTYMKNYFDMNFENVESKVVDRHSTGEGYASEMEKVGKEIKGWEKPIDLIFEHHVNSASGIAFGCEGLINLDDKVSSLFVDELTDDFSTQFLIRERRTKKLPGGEILTDGVLSVKPGERGSSGLKTYKGCNSKVSFIWEPCFGNERTKESINILKNENTYFPWISQYLGNKVGGVLKPNITLIDALRTESIEITTTQRVASLEPDPIKNTLLRELITVYKKASIKFKALKGITLAQWLLESGRATSKLAVNHNNFGGLKYRKEIEDISGEKKRWSIEYTGSDNNKDNYFAFKSIEEFVVGYWLFIGRQNYKGWERYGNDPVGYMEHLCKCGYSETPDYLTRVLKLLPEAERLLLSVKTEPYYKKGKEEVIKEGGEKKVGQSSISSGKCSQIKLQFDYEGSRINMLLNGEVCISSKKCC